MKPENFCVSEKNPKYFRSYCMKATAGKEITIELQSRKEMSCLNMKRRLDAVRFFSFGFLQNYWLKMFPYPFRTCATLSSWSRT